MGIENLFHTLTGSQLSQKEFNDNPVSVITGFSIMTAKSETTISFFIQTSEIITANVPRHILLT